MKCKDCECCHLVARRRWDSEIQDFQDKPVYECWGVRESFEIMDINRECTEYLEKREKKVEKTETFENKTNYFRFGNEDCAIEITPDDIVFIQRDRRITMSEILREPQIQHTCPYCGKEAGTIRLQGNENVICKKD